MSETEVFISHSTKDKEIAELYQQLLTSTDAYTRQSIFFSSDQDLSIPGGDDVGKTISVSLKSAHIIIYLLTENFFDSIFCVSELGAGWIQNDGSKILLPILLSQSKKVKDAYFQSPMSKVKYITDLNPNNLLDDDQSALRFYQNNMKAKKRASKISQQIKNYCAEHFVSSVANNSAAGADMAIKHSHSFYAEKVENELKKRGLVYTKHVSIVEGDLKMKIDFVLNMSEGKQFVETKFSKNYAQSQDNGDYYSGWIVVNKEMARKVGTWVFILESANKFDFLIIPKTDFRRILSQKKLVGANAFHFYVHSADGLHFEDIRDNKIDLSAYLNAWQKLNV
ncbi:toll/interleukin-1 receptor domain-containing protein [Oenococcus sp. UCMA 17063]|nr:toll/interleukin-1 receptor domain-containing protein [Oenococcus sp. UCMA 17063]